MSSNQRSAVRSARTRSANRRSTRSGRSSDESAAITDAELAGVKRRIVGYTIDIALLGTLAFGMARVASDWFGNGHAVLIAVLLIHPCIVVSYGAVLTSWRGATVGMMAAKLIAVDRSSCRLLQGRRALARSATAFALTGLALEIVNLWGFKSSANGTNGAIAAGAPFVTLAGYATYLYWAKWDPLHQTLQDKAARSVVLYAGARRHRRRHNWSWRVATSQLSRQYTYGYTTPVGGKGRR